MRHRLNRGGNRDANRALHLICVVRMRVDRRTQEYVARRTAEGKSKREIVRCLKRYVAREVYRVLVSTAALPWVMGVGLKAVPADSPRYLTMGASHHDSAASWGKIGRPC